MKIKLLLISLLLTGCNKQLIDMDYKYNMVHIYETNQCYELDSWKDYEGEQLQLNLKDYGKTLISSTDCLLVKDTCPICEKQKTEKDLIKSYVDDIIRCYQWEYYAYTYQKAEGKYNQTGTKNNYILNFIGNDYKHYIFICWQSTIDYGVDWELLKEYE